MNIIIKNHLLLYRGYKIKCSIGKLGLTNAKNEGDLTTPKGLFKIGCLYYREDRIKSLNCKIKKKVIKENMGWCDDPKSKNYNKEVKLPFSFRTEKLFRKNRIYDLLINIKYNQNPIRKKKGSAIFLHLTNSKYLATKGCVAILRKDFLKILPLITSKTKILIN